MLDHLFLNLVDPRKSSPNLVYDSLDLINVILATCKEYNINLLDVLDGPHGCSLDQRVDIMQELIDYCYNKDAETFDLANRTIQLLMQY